MYRRTATIMMMLAIPAVLVSCSDNGGTSAPSSTTPPTAVAVATAAPTTVLATTTTAVPTTTTEAVTTTTLSELEAAKLAYFNFTSEINAVVEEANAIGTAWSSAPAICALLAPAVEKFAQQVLEYDAWPTAAQDEIDALVVANAAVAGYYYDCAQAPGTQSAQEPIWALLTSSDGQAAASAVRLVLGLPIDR